MADKLTCYGTPPGQPGPVEGVIVDRAADDVEAAPPNAGPTAPVELTQFEMGFLDGLLDSLLGESDHVIARGIRLKLRAASLAMEGR